MSDKPDPNFQLLHALRLRFQPDVPLFVKEARVAQYQETDNLDPQLFADPVRLSLPVHTKAATWVSGLYFWGRQANGEPQDSSAPASLVEDRLFKAARAHRIFPEILALRDQINSRAEALQKAAALSDDDYVLHIGAERKLPAVDAASVRRSAERFYLDRVRYPYGVRKEAATRLLRKAVEFGVSDLPTEQTDYFIKAAGAYPASRTAVTYRLAARATVAKNEAVRQAFDKMASFLYGEMEKSSSVSSERREQACRLVDRVDREAALFDQYKYGMPMPEEIFYDGFGTKMAASAPSLSLPSGQTYRFSDLEDAAPCFEAVGPACADAVLIGGQVSIEKAAAWLADADSKDLQIFEAAMDAMGIGPILEKEAAFPPGALVFERMATLPLSTEKRSDLLDGPPVFRVAFKLNEDPADLIGASALPAFEEKVGSLLDRNPLNV